MQQSPDIRLAALPDVPLLTEMGRKTFLDAFSKDNTQENVDLFLASQYGNKVIAKEMTVPGAAFFLAYLEGVPVGYTKLRTGHEPPELWDGLGIPAGPALEVERIYVVAGYQDKKIGSAIMAHNVEYGRIRGFSIIWLGAWERNVHAKRFYERLGFEAFGSHIFMLGTDPQTDILMRKRI